MRLARLLTLQPNEIVNWLKEHNDTHELTPLSQSLPMEMLEVESSNLAEIGWKDSLLHVQFKGGATYEYADVPRRIFFELYLAESVGKFFNREIKDVFAYKKL